MNMLLPLPFVPEALVFDFDGVLVDSEPLHHRCISEEIAARGLTPVSAEEYNGSLMGFDDRDAFRAALASRGVEPTPELVAQCVARKADRFAALAESGAVPPLPGAADFVRACAARRPCALCSGALASDVAPVLARLGLADAFAAVVTADCVAVSKPDPESYRRCLEALAAKTGHSFDPARCFAFEDSLDGIRSARGAGLTVVGVATFHPPADLLAAGASLAVPGLAALSWPAEVPAP